MSRSRDIAKFLGLSDSDNPSNLSLTHTGSAIGLDSALTTQIIDSAYVAARSSAGGTDSAATLSLIGIDGIIREHSHTISANVTLDSAKNGLVAGPIFIDSGVTVTINDSATLVIA